MAKSHKLCDFCKEEFPENTFLKHVIAKKDCKLHYKDQLDSMKEDGYQAKLKRQRQSQRRKLHGNNDDLANVVCENCKQNFFQWTIIKHLAQSKQCKSHYGKERYEEMKTSNRKTICRIDNKRKLEKYHKLSKDAKDSLLAKQKEKRIAAKKAKKEKWAEMSKDPMERVKSYKHEFPKKAKELNMQRKQQAEERLGKINPPPYPLLDQETEMVMMLKEKILFLYNYFDKKVDGMIEELKDSTSHKTISNKYGMFMKTSLETPQTTGFICEEWDQLNREITTKFRKIDKDMRRRLYFTDEKELGFI